MARDLRPKHKLCRRFGEKLCDAQKCPVARRSYPSGQHGPQQKHVKLSGFGKQLREKQKAKRMYGILEKQFSNYVAEASKKTGDTSKILLSYLESRLDNIVYRMGLAPTRSAARQLVNHGHIKVNDKKVDIPSFRVKVGDVIVLGSSSRKSKLFEGVSERLAKIEFPSWLTVDTQKVSGKVLNAPIIDDPNFNAKSIIEFYSR
jgi:small subunit ribosomal protein S4